MPNRKRRLYWDSSCFIALFNAEPTTPQPQLDAIQATFAEMLGGGLKIVTSDIYRAEVFGTSDENAQLVADQLLACPDFDIVPLRTQAFQLASDLRRQCHEAKPKRSLKTADALHIAGGTLARADEIWTTDKKLVSYCEDGLLGPVEVCLPYLNQLRIPF